MKPLKKISGVQVIGQCDICGPVNGKMLVEEVHNPDGTVAHLCRSHKIELDPETAAKAKKGVEDMDWFTSWFRGMFPGGS